MVPLRALALEDAPALARTYSGASIRHTRWRCSTARRSSAAGPEHTERSVRAIPGWGTGNAYTWYGTAVPSSA
ncbi:hypothetical protein [Streptomyces platensis]|uniref:hypothetical protein n=1 Tax=Streptomyces platensis TaxID=58346 RepID=UPI00331A0AD2